MKLPLLVSYALVHEREAEWRDYFQALAPAVEWLVDSGAFTLHAQRIQRAKGMTATRGTLTVADYVAWLAEAAPRLWGYIALDVVHDRAATEQNLVLMRSAGLDPMPVLTRDHASEELPRLVAMNPRVCVAGGIRKPIAWTTARLRHAPVGARVHMLGQTHRGLTAVPGVGSADCSSWTAGQRFFQAARWNAAQGWTRWTRAEVWEAGRAWGLPPSRAGWYSTAGLLNAREWLACQRYFAARDKRLFLVVGFGLMQLEILLLLSCPEAAAGLWVVSEGRRRAGMALAPRLDALHDLALRVGSR